MTYKSSESETSQFRLPRSVKKRLKGNIWLYPADEKGNSLMAWPTRSQKDYSALKKGIVRNIMDPKNSKARRKAYHEKINKENVVTDEQLELYVNDIFREDLRRSAYKTFIAAKNNPKAIKAYYHFVNAYQEYEAGNDSSGNICSLALDRAKELLKPKRK